MGISIEVRGKHNLKVIFPLLGQSHSVLSLMNDLGQNSKLVDFSCINFLSRSVAFLGLEMKTPPDNHLFSYPYRMFSVCFSLYCLCRCLY